MDGRIRNPDTRISKPIISRNGSLQQLGILGKESSGSTVYASCGRSAGDLYSKSPSAKLQPVGYHDPVQPVSTDLPETTYTIDRVSFFSPTRAREPQLPKENDTQDSVHNPQGLDCFCQHPRDDSHSQAETVFGWIEGGIQAEGEDGSVAQLSDELSQTLQDSPRNSSSGGEDEDFSHATRGTGTQTAGDCDEFDEQVDDAALIDIETMLSTPVSDEVSSSSLSGSRTDPPPAVRQQHHKQDQKPSMTLRAVKIEGVADEDPTSPHSFRVLASAMTASNCPSVSRTPDPDDLQSSSSPRKPTLADSGSYPAPQGPITNGSGTIPVHSVPQPNRNSGATCIPKSLCHEERCTGTAEKASQALATCTESNLGGNPLMSQASLKNNIPAQASAPTQGSLKGEKSLPRQIPPNSCAKPFMRPPFPTPISSRSPVQGLTSVHTLLRTCFRVGEALNASLSRIQRSPQSAKHLPNPCHPQAKGIAPSASSTILIELYAFVEHSYRSNRVQFFRFADLFSPSHPPYLCGVWHNWNDNPVYDNDGRTFLGDEGREWKYTDDAAGHHKRKRKREHANADPADHDLSLYRSGGGRKMCRAVGVIDRNAGCNGRNTFEETGFAISHGPCLEGVTMTVLSIWEVEWADVEYVKGIVDAC